MDLKELDSGVDPNTHWYYQSKKMPLFEYIEQILQKKKTISIIDVGAGSGFFSHQVCQKYTSHIAKTILVDTGYSENEIKESNSKTYIKQHHLPDEIHDSLVLLMDVLEHIEDDKKMLLDIKKKSIHHHSNYYFITVPAFQGLWSQHDIYLEHFRRYTSTSLKALLHDAGFKADRIYYLYGSLFPLVYLNRKFSQMISSKKSTPTSDMKPLPFWLNALLLKYSSFEMVFTKYNKLFGISCVAEGRF